MEVQRRGEFLKIVIRGRRDKRGTEETEERGEGDKDEKKRGDEKKSGEV